MKVSRRNGGAGSWLRLREQEDLEVDGGAAELERLTAELRETQGAAFSLTEDALLSKKALRTNEARMRGQNEAVQAAMNGAPLEAALDILACLVTEETDGAARTAFYIADAAGRRLHPIRGAGDMPEDYLDRVDGCLIGEDSLACGLAVPTGRPVVIREVFEDSRWGPWVAVAEEFDYRGCWSFPIKTRDNKAVGTFAMYFRGTRDATPQDLALADRERAVLLGGTLSIESHRGQGTAIFVRIPYSMENSTEIGTHHD